VSHVTCELFGNLKLLVTCVNWFMVFVTSNNGNDLISPQNAYDFPVKFNSCVPSTSNRLKRLSFTLLLYVRGERNSAANGGYKVGTVARPRGVGGLNPPLATRITPGIRTKPQRNFFGKGGRGTPLSCFNLLEIVTV
jgi:hypothetical protein